METATATPAASAPSAAPVTSATSAPVAAPASTLSQPSAPSEPKAAPSPAVNDKGSDANIKSRLSKARNADIDEKIQKASDNLAALPGDPAPKSEPVSPIADTADLIAHVDTLAKSGKPIKYTVAGKEHEVKSAKQLSALLAQGHAHGDVSRELSGLKKHVAENYGAFDARVEKDPVFASLLTDTFNDPDALAFARRVLDGETTEEDYARISQRHKVVNPDRIKASTLQRRVDAIDSEKAAAEAVSKIDAHLDEIADKWGYRMDPAKEADVRLFAELKGRIQSGEAKDLVAAFRLSEKYEQVIAQRAEAKAAEAAEAKRLEKVSNQSSISRAEGFSGGGAKVQPKTTKGSDADMLARLRASNKRS